MYVCGRGTEGYGTVLPAVYEWKRMNMLADIYIAGASPEGIDALKEKVAELNKLFGFEIRPRYLPESHYNSEAYEEAILKISKPACAIVVTPDNLHRKIAGKTIENDLHTLVVKPLAPTVKEVLELIELQEKYNVYCAVEFHKRLDRSNLKLRDTILSGRIGTPLYFIIEYSQRKSIPLERFKAWAKTTNIFQYLGVHYADIIYFATKALPLRAMAIGQKMFLASKGIDTYDSIQAIVEWRMPSGEIFSSSFFTNWIDPETSSAMSDQKIKVIATKGRFEADQKRRGIYIVHDTDGIEEPNPDFCSIYGYQKGNISFQGYGIESILQFFRDVVRVESEGKEIEAFEGVRPTFKASIVPTAIIEAVNKSLKYGSRWIDIRFLGDKYIELL